MSGTLRTVVLIGLAVALLLLVAARRFSGPRVSGPDARRLVAAGATLLDVRTTGEFAGGHLPGALNIPVQNLGARLAEVPTGRPVIVYCASGMRSASAAHQLRAAGRTEVHDLGGMANWGP